MNTNQIQLPQEVVDEIKQAAKNTLSRASKSLQYSAGYFDGYLAGATAYAEKLHQVEQDNAELRRQNEKIKEQATGWRPLLEKVLHRHKGGLLPDRLLYLEIKKFLYGE